MKVIFSGTARIVAVARGECCTGKTSWNSGGEDRVLCEVFEVGGFSCGSGKPSG